MPAPALDCPGCAARDEQIAGLQEREATLTAQVAELQERLARLERLLSRNSGNSSMPPSADDLPGRCQAPGHEGRARLPDTPRTGGHVVRRAR